MKTMTQPDLFSSHPNSLLVWRDKVQPTLNGRKQQVYEALKAIGGSGTMYEVGQHLNLPLNHISGRFRELERFGFIEETPLHKIHHENRFVVWEVKK
jgi:hypothetical protein